MVLSVAFDTLSATSARWSCPSTRPTLDKNRNMSAMILPTCIFHFPLVASARAEPQFPVSPTVE